MVRKAIPVGLFAFTTLVWLALVFVPFDWSSWPPEACRLQNCYCDPFRPGWFVLQPISALSNLGYIAAGCLVLAFVPRREKTAAWLSRETGYAIWYGVALNLTGWFSFISHASLSRVGEWFDLMGVYQLAGLLIVFNWKRLARPRSAVLAAFFAGLMVLLGLQMVFAPRLQQVMIGLLLAAVIGLEVAARVRRPAQRRSRLLLLAMTLFALGGAAWSLLGRTPVCPPGQVPWHLFWHLLSAAAALSLYFYYRSERE